MKTKENWENKELIPYTEALALKELGFDWPSFFWFTHSLRGNDYITAPLYQQVRRWFQEKYRFHYYIQCGKNGTHWTAWLIRDWNLHHKGSGNFDYFDNQIGINNNYEGFNSYEEAELACIREMIKIIKNQ